VCVPSLNADVCATSDAQAFDIHLGASPNTAARIDAISIFQERKHCRIDILGIALLVTQGQSSSYCTAQKTGPPADVTWPCTIRILFPIQSGKLRLKMIY
jgi:hypothetical protein